MNMLEMLMKLPGMEGVLNKAPLALSEFLDKLLEENRPLLNKQADEQQIFYVLFKNEKAKEYVISIVAADSDDKILRSIKSIYLKDALSVIFNNNNKNAE